jgi:DNA-directed RNA polymerase subunit RPC12/RpoP
MSSLDRLADHRRQKADDLFRLARISIRSGERAEGRRLLLQAVDNDRDHSEAWLWLSATTDDPVEQRQYLDWAVAADPSNARARRGLAILTGQLDVRQLAKANDPGPGAPQGPSEAEVRRTYDCPQCGGRLRFDPERVDLVCVSCGHVEVIDEVPLVDGARPLDFALPTRSGHRWAETERVFACEQCGASTVLPVGQASTVCPFCGNAALVNAPEDRELLEPQGLAPMALEADDAAAAVQRWLGGHWWAPDDLGQMVRDRRLHPAYVPFWVFEASLTVHWRAEVAEGDGGARRWVARTGERTSFFTRELQCGLRSLTDAIWRRLPALELERLIVFKPEYLADWPTALYDRSLADASLLARERMVKAAATEARSRVDAGQAVRDLEVTGSDFSGQAYRLVYWPLWVGSYQYRGRAYQVLVDGQTGRAAGELPRDRVKIGLAIALAGILLAIAAAVILPLLAY